MVCPCLQRRAADSTVGVGGAVSTDSTPQASAAAQLQAGEEAFSIDDDALDVEAEDDTAGGGSDSEQTPHAASGRCEVILSTHGRPVFLYS